MNTATGSPGRRRTAILRRVGWLAVASMVGLSLAGPGVGIASATQPEDHKVTICHATPPDTAANGWNQNSVDISSSGHLQGGHDTEHAADIIPPYTYQPDDGPLFTFDGLNWDATGQAIYNNGCNPPKTDTCADTAFTATVNAVEWALPAYLGRYTYPLLTVKVFAPDGVPEGCEKSWSLNAYTTQGPTWETSGTQALFDHDSVTLDSETTSGTLTVEVPPCYGQTDFYEGTKKFAGTDGPLPHFDDSIVPDPGLIAYSNGGTACTTTTTTSSTTTGTTTTGTTTTGTTTTGTTTTGTTTTRTTTDDTTTTGTTTTGTTTTGTTTTGTTTTGTVSGVTTTATTTTGSVSGVTGKPTVTPPPTDTLPAGGTPDGDSWRLALLAVAGLLATLLLLAPATPAKAHRRR